MKDFARYFLRDALGKPACWAAFGKHPGWDDHADDLGLITESLVAAKQLLYLEGISGQLASGAWDRLGTHALAFDHSFLWTREDQTLVGSLWESRDGKGRTRFPMVICLQIDGNAEAEMGKHWPLLQKLENQIQSATTAGEVVDLWRSAGFSSEDSPIAQFSVQTEQIADIWSAMHIVFSNYLTKNYREKSDLAAATIRLPTVALEPLANLQFWRRFLAGSLDRRVPLLLLQGRKSDWLDAIAGPPESEHLFCLKAGKEILPVARAPTDPATLAQAAAYLQKVNQGPVEPPKRGLFGWSS